MPKIIILAIQFFKKEYGFPLKDVEAIDHFFSSFKSVENPWYCKVKVDNDTTFLALTSANTFGDPRNSARIKDEFRKHLKKHKADYVLPFAYYFIVAAHLMTKDLTSFEFWDIYPSSGREDVNSDLVYFAKKASHTFGKIFQNERLFIRKEESFKRHTRTEEQRISDGCDEQFRTMIINPFYRDKLKGKNVCVIDDFSRHGTSCETVRIMLKEAGVNKILFIAMGKFKADAVYNNYHYKLSGDIFSKFTFKKIGHRTIAGNLNTKANKDFIESLGKWI